MIILYRQTTEGESGQTRKAEGATLVIRGRMREDILSLEEVEVLVAALANCRQNVSGTVASRRDDLHIPCKGVPRKNGHRRWAIIITPPMRRLAARTKP